MSLQLHITHKENSNYISYILMTHSLPPRVSSWSLRFLKPLFKARLKARDNDFFTIMWENFDCTKPKHSIFYISLVTMILNKSGWSHYKIRNVRFMNPWLLNISKSLTKVDFIQSRNVSHNVSKSSIGVIVHSAFICWNHHLRT